MIIALELLVVLLLLSFFSYQLYVRWQLEHIDSDNPKMKKKINFYKHQANSRSLLLLMSSALIFCLLLMGMLYTQFSLSRANKKLEMKMEESTVFAGTSTIEQYNENTLQLTDFPWAKVLESRDTNALTNYEVQLSKEWQPFFSDANIVILKSQNTQTLSVSVFTSVLSFDNYEQASNNVDLFVKELSKAKEISMIDFSFTYRDKNNAITKQSFVYTRDAKADELKKVNLEK